MDELVRLKDLVLLALSTVGSILANLFGGWDTALWVLIWFMAADYITGLLVAGIFQRSPKSEGGALDSGAGFKGLVRKGGILLLVLLAALLDRVTNAAFIRTAVCLFFIANEGLSILENLGLMGISYPAFLRNMLEALRKTSDEGGEAHG